MQLSLDTFVASNLFLNKSLSIKQMTIELFSKEGLGAH